MTHVDVSSLASKTNPASLKTEVDKLDIPKLSTVPADLAKLTNKVANYLVEENDFNALEKKVTDNKTEQDNLETKVTSNHLATESSINALKTKVDSIDLTKYVKKSDYVTKVGNLELKIPEVSRLLQTSTFNSKITEIERKITAFKNKIPDISGLASKTELTTVDNKIPDISGLASKTEPKNVKNKIPDSNAFVEKTDYATEISGVENDYVTNAALTSQLSYLKSFRGNYYFNQHSYLIYEPKPFSFKQISSGITHWKSTGIDNSSVKTDLRGFWRNKNECYLFWKLHKRKQINILNQISSNYLHCLQVRHNKVKQKY